MLSFCRKFDLSCLLPETAIRTMLKESAISAERFYLLETIWPDFYKKAEAGLPHPELSRKDPSSFSVALKHYYTDNLRSPYREAGLSEKKAAFGRAVAFLRSTEQGVNRDLFIQETAAILNVTVQSIVQELRTGRSAAAEPPAPPVKREIRSAADPIIQTERNLIKEILRFPQLFGVYYPALRQLSFEDEYSESLFRYLETRYLMGQVWDLRILSEGNLTNETVSVFTGLIVSEETSDDSIPEHHADYMDELILDHRIRRLKKQIRKKEESMVLLPADRLVEAAREQSQLVKELKELEKKKTRSRD